VGDELSEWLGRPWERVHTAARPGDVRDSQADPPRLRELSPDVAPVDSTAGLGATLDWFACHEVGQRVGATASP
jgi:UDP-glucose 4-epimerase